MTVVAPILMQPISSLSNIMVVKGTDTWRVFLSHGEGVSFVSGPDFPEMVSSTSQAARGVPGSSTITAQSEYQLTFLLLNQYT